MNKEIKDHKKFLRALFSESNPKSGQIYTIVDKNQRNKILQVATLRGDNLYVGVNPTKFKLIEKAFRAKNFSDIIKHYNENKSIDDPFFHCSIEPKLYYILSQINLGEEVDEIIYDQIEKSKELANDQNRGLYKALELRFLIKKLQDEHKNISPISWGRDYQDAKKLLNCSDLLNHFLYNELYERLEALISELQTEDFKKKLDTLLKRKGDDDFTLNDFINLCNLLIDRECYDEVIKKVEEFHNKNSPTIETFNILGVCFERKNAYSEAFKQYQYAVNLMEECKEFDHVILSNYLDCSKKGSEELSEERLSYLREKLNISLVSLFQWDIFTANNVYRLFKYYPFNTNTLDSLINQYFYFSSKSQLNDPIELPSIENIGKECLLDSNHKICSFSNNNNSMLMWSHYTQNHEGIMIEYQFGAELPAGIGVDKIKYTNSGKRKKDDESNKYIFTQFLLTKNKEWSYEKEVRLFSYKQEKVYYENYQYPNHDRNRINAKILSITLGCKFPQGKIQLIKRIVIDMNMKKKHHEPKVLLKQSRISKNNLFELEYLDVDI